MVGEVERLYPVVCAAGEGPIGASGCAADVAGLVPGVGLVVPFTIVEACVVVGHLGAAEPVDGHARVVGGVGGVGVVAGVHVGGGADHPEGGAVVPNVGMACGGGVLHEGVVDADLGGAAVACPRRDEDQAEAAAHVEAAGDQAPVGGDLRVGGRGIGAGDGDRVGLHRRPVLGGHRHRDRRVADGERDLVAVRGVVGIGGRDLDRGAVVVGRRRNRGRVHPRCRRSPCTPACPRRSRARA